MGRKQVSAVLEGPSSSLPPGMQEELLKQGTLQQTLDGAASRTSGINARVAADLMLGKDPDAHQETVILLKFSRNPSLFHELLQTSAQLDGCRQALEDEGFPWRLPSGAYIFVKGNQYQAVVAWLTSEGVHLGPAHVVVSTESEAIVIDVVNSIPRSHKICEQRRLEVALGSQGCSPSEAGNGSDQLAITITRTFIHVMVPSSLRSMPTDGQKTVSTTDACERRGLNPRKL